MPPQSRPDPTAGFGRSTRGSVAVQVALLLLLVLGFIALGVEVSQLLLEQRKQQSAADSAAMAAASAALAGVTDLRGEARAVAASLGYNDAANDVAVTVANPPASGAYAGNSQYVEVDVERTFTPALVQLFRRGAFTVRARATAKAAAGSSACLMALDTSGANAIDISNNAVVTTPGCGLATNSTSNSSINVRNNATVNGSLTTAGDVAVGNNATITGSVAKHTVAVTDPYANMPLPPKGGRKTASSCPSSLSEGWYPNGWDFSANCNIALGAGTYYVGTKLTTKPNVTITGTGVQIILDGSFAITIGSNAVLTLSAPTGTTMPGVLFYSSASNSSKTHTFGSNGTLKLTGALYFPSQAVSFSNNTSTGGSSCTQVVARTIQILQNADLTFNSSCSGAGTSTLGSSGSASLVE